MEKKVFLSRNETLFQRKETWEVSKDDFNDKYHSSMIFYNRWFALYVLSLSKDKTWAQKCICTN